MARKILLTVAGKPVAWSKNEDSLDWISGLTVDADGSPRAYHPKDKGLDYLANAGHPGNWWGVLTNKAGQPIVQVATDPCPGFYISTTAYVRQGFTRLDPRAYLDSEKVPFIVVPAPLRTLVKATILGCRARVTHLLTGNSIEAVVGDIGPATHLGEASIAVAKELGVPSDPRKGGCETDISYEIFPGVPAPGFVLQPMRG